MALTLTEVTTPTATGWNAWGHCWASGFGSAGMFLVCGTRTTGNDRILTTEDCVTYTYRTSPSASLWRSVAYSPTLNRAVIVGFQAAGFSDDGITWSAAASLPGALATNNWADVCWWAAQAKFVAVANTGTSRVMTSVDGTTWVAQLSADEAKGWTGVKASTNAVVAVAAESSVASNQLIMRATDSAAASWALVTTPSTYLTGNDINNLGASAVAYSDTLGMFAIPVNTNAAPGRLVITSIDDGVTWVENTIPTPTDGRQNKGIVWIGDQFYLQKYSGFYYLTSPDGAVWTKTTTGAAPSHGDHDAVAWSSTLGKALSCERAPSVPFKALIVAAPLAVITITPTTVPDAYGDTPYSEQLAGGGGTGPYTFLVTVGSLPTGLTLSSAGLISGTPTTTAAIAPTTLPNAVVDVAYSQQLSVPEVTATSSFTVRATDANAATGIQPYTMDVIDWLGPTTYAVVSGALPKCITCSASGLISGTSVQVGVATFTIRATDDNGRTVDRAYTLTSTS